MNTRQIFFLICVGLVAWLGFSHGWMTRDAVVAAPIAAEGCAANVQVNSIERLEIGTVSETFLVKWATTSGCVQSFNVTLTIRRSDGSTRDETQKFEGSVRQGLFKLLGKRDDKLTTQATATVRASGILAAKATDAKALNTATAAPLGNGTGSNNPKPAPTFRLSGQVRNKKEGNQIQGATITFELLNNNERKAPQPVETNAQGRWTQDGFPVGTKVRVTAVKRFLVTEPVAQVVTQTGAVDFVMFSPDSNKPAALTFSVKGIAQLNSQKGQTPVAGATVTFFVINPNGVAQPNVPGPVTTQADGSWPQNGFTVGVSYQARVAKSGINFGSASANFTGNTAGQTITDLGFIGSPATGPTPTPKAAPTPPPPTPLPTPTPAPGGVFSAKGKAVSKAPDGSLLPIAGCAVTFQILDAKNISQPKLPGSVTTQANGQWTQSGFSVGVLYQVKISKTGVLFQFNTQNLFGNSNGQSVTLPAFGGQLQ